MKQDLQKAKKALKKKEKVVKAKPEVAATRPDEDLVAGNNNLRVHLDEAAKTKIIDPDLQVGLYIPNPYLRGAAGEVLGKKYEGCFFPSSSSLIGTSDSFSTYKERRYMETLRYYIDLRAGYCILLLTSPLWAFGPCVSTQKSLARLCRCIQL